MAGAQSGAGSVAAGGGAPASASLKIWALVLLGAGFVFSTFGPEPFGPQEVTDLPIYAGYADRMLDGQLPYRDFGFEYPPLAALVILLGGVAGAELDKYSLLFGELMFAAAAAVVLLTSALARVTGGDARKGLFAAVMAVFLCGALARTRFDLVPVALTLGALLLLCAHRPRAGMAVLGVAVLMKGFPLVVAPVAVVWLVARGERAAALQGAGAMAAVLVVGAIAALSISASGFEDSLRYHADRPAQVESSPAVVMTTLSRIGVGEARYEFSFGAVGAEHPDSGLVLALFTGLLLGALALIAGAVSLPRDPDGRALVLASFAAVSAFIVFGKVLSPQFLIWIAPLGALALLWRMYLLAGAVVGAQVLTLVEYPELYGRIAGGHFATTMVVGLRNALLVAVIVLALWPLVTRRDPARAAARSRRPDRLRRPRPAPR